VDVYTLLLDISRSGLNASYSRLDGTLRVTLPDGSEIIGGKSRVEARLEGEERLVVKIKTGSWSPTRVVLEGGKMGHARAVLLYSWLESVRGEARSIIARAGSGARRSGPSKLCVDILESRGVKVSSWDCHRIVAGVIYALATAGVLLDKSVEEMVGTLIVPPSSLDQSLQAGIDSSLSTYRILRPALNNPDVPVGVAGQIASKLKEGLLYARVGLQLAGYIDRIPYTWTSLLPGLLHSLEVPVRNIHPCTTTSMFEAGLLGEGLWVLRGSGSVACRPRSPVSTGFALFYPDGPGPRILLQSSMPSSIGKCASMGLLKCKSVSIALLPGEQAVSQASTLYSQGYAVRAYYYRGKLLVLAVIHPSLARGTSRLSALSIVEDVGGSPLRALMAYINGKPHSGSPESLPAGALERYDRLLRLL